MRSFVGSLLIVMCLVWQSQACSRKVLEEGIIEWNPNPDEPYIRELENKVNTGKEALGKCVDCEATSSAAAQQAQKCRAVVCDFEIGVLCYYMTSGKPGATDEMVADFIKKNPQFGSGEEAEITNGVTYEKEPGQWSEYINREQDDDQQHAIDLISESFAKQSDDIKDQVATKAAEAAAAAAAGQVPGGLGGFGGLVSRSKRRVKRQLPAGFENILGDINADKTFVEPALPGGELGEQWWGPEANGYGRPHGALPQGGYALEQLGVDVKPGDREAYQAAMKKAQAKAADAEAMEDFVATPSDKTWGVFKGTFVDDVVGVPEAAEGARYAVTYVYPGEKAVLETAANFVDDSYFLYYDVYENSDDVVLKVCCGPCDEVGVAVSTKVNDEVDRKEWRKHAVLCPKGTKQVTYICENMGETGVEGSCGLDNIQLYSSEGVDYCEGVDFLAGTNPAEGLPQSVLDRTSAKSGNLDGDVAKERVSPEDAKAIEELLKVLENQNADEGRFSLTR